MKSRSSGFIILDSLLSFIVVVVAINLISSYGILRYKNNLLEYNDFSKYLNLNEVYFKEGVDYRYDAMYERVLSYWNR